MIRMISNKRISPLLLRNLPNGITPSRIRMRMMRRIVSSADLLAEMLGYASLSAARAMSC